MDNTSSPRGRSRPGAHAQGMPGVKMVISALALMTTLIGWMWLAREPLEVPAAPALPAVPRPGRAVALQLSPLPTLVPLDAAPAPHPLAQEPPASAGSAPLALTGLRMVSAPPPAPVPVAVTQSSR